MSISGKSSASKRMKEFYPDSYILEFYNYFNVTNMPIINFYGREITNWENPIGIEWEELLKDFDKIESKLIFVDSFLLFYYPEFVNKLTAAVVFEYSENDMEIAANRRVNRYSDTNFVIDFSNTNVFESQEQFLAFYFRDVVWKSGWENKWMWDGSQAKIPILTLSATGDFEKNISQIYSFISDILNQQNQ
jgi:hypothetical protein